MLYVYLWVLDQAHEHLLVREGRLLCCLLSLAGCVCLNIGNTRYRQTDIYVVPMAESSVWYFFRAKGYLLLRLISYIRVSGLRTS